MVRLRISNKNRLRVMESPALDAIGIENWRRIVFPGTLFLLKSRIDNRLYF